MNPNNNHKVTSLNERSIQVQEVCGALKVVIEALEEGADDGIIVMRAVPAEDPDETEVSLYVHCPDIRLVSSMVTLLQEWVTRNIPPPGPTN
jgi:hypothetical protein